MNQRTASPSRVTWRGSSPLLRPVSLLLLLLRLRLLIADGQADITPHDTYQPEAHFPREITLRTGVFHVPPFMFVDRKEDGSNINTIEFRGFIPELLERIQAFAAADNVTLNFLLTLAPDEYNPALDRVANDCFRAVENPEENCGKLDMITTNYYASPGRSLRVHLSPSWLRSTTSTIKYLDKNGSDYTTLTEAQNGNATVCMQGGTFYATKVRAKFPDIHYEYCQGIDSCIGKLKREECVLLAADELELRYLTAWDTSLEVTREHFNTNFVVWPMSFELDPIVKLLMGRWIYQVVTNSIVDELYSKHFQKALCPVGTAGEFCEKMCHPIHGSADVRGACVCRSTKWTGEDCSIEVLEDTNTIPMALKTIAYVMVGINVGTIMLFSGWLYWQRKSTQVKVCQPMFLLLVLLGCLISSCTIIALAQEDEGNGAVPACMAIPWLYSVGFSVTFGTLFAKIRRVYLLFDAALGCAHQIVTVRETFTVIGLVLLVDVAILVVWTLVDPLHWQRIVTLEDQFGEPLESEGYCTSDHWLPFASTFAVLHLMLLSVACYVCYLSRGIPTQFSEGKYVTIAMVSNLQILVVGVPILVILGVDSTAGFFVRSVIVFMNDFAVVTLIFGNLIYITHFAPSGVRQQSVLTAIGTAMRQYSTHQNSEGSKRSLCSNGSFGSKGRQQQMTETRQIPSSEPVSSVASRDHVVSRESQE